MESDGAFKYAQGERGVVHWSNHPPYGFFPGVHSPSKAEARLFIGKS